MQIRTRFNTLMAAALRAGVSTIARALTLATLAGVATTSASAGLAYAGFQDFGTNHFSIDASNVDLFNQPLSYQGASGVVTASATKGPIPSISGANIAGAATSASYTNSQLAVRMYYGFQVHGPSINVGVPVIISGLYQMDSIGSSYYYGRANLSLYVASGGGGLFQFNKDCQYICSDGGTFAGLMTVGVARPITVYEDMYLFATSFYGGGGVREGAGSASAYLDPYISIDPTWALANPGYSVAVEPGFGNAAPTNSVPEPETYTLLLSGLVLMGAIGRRRKQKNGLRLVG